jgi:hypothetical protein
MCVSILYHDLIPVPILPDRYLMSDNAPLRTSFCAKIVLGDNRSFDPSIPLMFNPTLFTQIDALKARLDRIRPLAPDLVENGVFCINPRKGGFWKLMRRGLG